MDREQMVAGLQSLAENIYFGRTVTIPEFTYLEMAIEQLKPKRVVRKEDMTRCPNCNTPFNGWSIDRADNYCWTCGQAVKWDD